MWLVMILLHGMPSSSPNLNENFIEEIDIACLDFIGATSFWNYVAVKRLMKRQGDILACVFRFGPAWSVESVEPGTRQVAGPSHIKNSDMIKPDKIWSKIGFNR